ncbi:MAG TPA: DUF72 domain-containing protein [Sedimentisphaerales bacterium]|nr:DUF72 domain-containing protein [Sedimentisphaerales bacterium]
MTEGKPDIRIGTSGWHYGHWAGLFYPEQLPKSKWFAYYAGHFDTVEINNTFYQLPKPVSLKNWYAQAPVDFVYSVKANRFITHIRKLKEPSEAVGRFFERVGILKEKLGVVLYQLPPSLHKDLGRLEAFINILPKDVPCAFEFRHKSWFSNDTFALLETYGAAFCIHDLGGIDCPAVVTGKIIYIRFHGAAGRYQGSYSQAQLKNWARWIKDHTAGIEKVYVYFNNDFEAKAVANAKALKSQF